MCMSLGIEILFFWLLGDEKEGKTETKRGRIATNAHVVPKEHMKG